MSESITSCAHLTIRWCTKEEHGITSGWWECMSECGARFWPIIRYKSPPIGTVLKCLLCAHENPWAIFSETTGETVCVECRGAKAGLAAAQQRIAELEREKDNAITLSDTMFTKVNEIACQPVALAGALRYARRFLDEKEHDTAFVDAALQGIPPPVDWRALVMGAAALLLGWLRWHNAYPKHRCEQCGGIRDWLRAWEAAKAQK